MAALLVLAAGLFVARGWWAGRDRPEPLVVEVRGEVPQPGYHALVPPAGVRDALAAAGADPGAFPDASLEPGTRLVVEAGSVRLETMDELLVVGLPIDVNGATSEALQAVPGLGPSKADAIVADRTARGPFASVDDLERVKGIGPATVEDLRPFLTARPVE